MKRSMLAAVVVLGFSGSAFAQLGSPEKVIHEPNVEKVRSVTEINFSDIILEAGRVGPAEAYTPSRRPATFENLIEVRSSFTPELQGSIDSL